MSYKNKKDLYTSQMKRWNRNKIKAIEHLGNQCKDCGNKFHPACYDFHHRNPIEKEFVWDKLRLKSWDKIVLEIAKCDLLCSNCHRMRHVRNELWEYAQKDSNLQPTA